VFPSLATREILLASTTSVSGWDSLAAATLMTVVEEEFRVQIDPGDLEHLQSFSALFEYVDRRVAAARA
jgi:acyl carrier protein